MNLSSWPKFEICLTRSRTGSRFVSNRNVETEEDEVKGEVKGEEEEEEPKSPRVEEPKSRNRNRK